MPNWAEGNLRIRGTHENILNFLREEVVWCAYGEEFGGEAKEYPVVVNYDEQYGSIEIGQPEELAQRKGKGEPWLYIKDTMRNFPEIGNYDLYLHPNAETDILCFECRAAWGFHSDPYLEKARKHQVDIKIIAYERGMEFKQTIEIVGGEIVRDEDTQYEDWDWEAEFPHMGG